MDSIRVLLLQPDLEKAQVAADSLAKLGVHELECVANGMECIACYESYRPHLVVVDATTDEMPIRFIVQAMRQLDSGPHIFVWSETSDIGAQSEARAIGAHGVVTIPLDIADITQLLGDLTAMDEPTDDETIAGFVDDSSSLWDIRAERRQRLDVEGAELNRRRSFYHEGDLRVVGNLRGIESLEVTGLLEINGNVQDAHILCKGDLVVRGGINDCGRMGIFARRSMEVGRIKDSMIVCGGALLLGETCENSVVNVAGRFIGKSRSSVLAGGKTRVGEHLMIGILGDESAVETEVELAAKIFYQHWIAHRRKLFREAGSMNVIDRGRQQWFERQVSSRLCYHLQADLCAQWIYPGIKVRVGELEEMIVHPLSAPVRVHLAQQSNGYTIAFARRKDPVTIATK